MQAEVLRSANGMRKRLLKKTLIGEGACQFAVPATFSAPSETYFAPQFSRIVLVGKSDAVH
jgi:hypothetical protein